MTDRALSISSYSEALVAPVRLTFLADGGALGELIRSYDWSSTPLGPPQGWPGGLRTLVQVMLTSQQPMFIAWGPKRTMLYNDGYAPMLSDKHPWALGKPFNEVWADIIADVGPIMDAAYAGVPTYMDDIEFQMMRNGHLVETHFSFGYTPVHDESDQIAGMFCTALEITAEVATAKSRTQELSRLRDLLENAPSFMAIVSGPEHRFELTNAAYRQLIGHRDMIGLTVRDALPELDGQGFYELLDNVYEKGETFVGRGLEIDLQRSPGAPLQKGYLNFVYQPMRDENGTVTGIFVEGNDVSDQKAAEFALRESALRQETLSGELQHRIKNSLAMVSAIAGQTLRGDDIAERRQSFSSRLGALASAHDILTSRTWKSAPIQSVVESALTPHMSGPDRFVLEGINLELDPKQSVSMALAIHELATNAVKYGAMSTPGGAVHLHWGLDGAEFFFRWTESGGPPVAEPSQKGFGSRLVTRVLAADFRGRVSIDYARDGVVCELRAPADSVLSDTAAVEAF